MKRASKLICLILKQLKQKNLSLSWPLSVIDGQVRLGSSCFTAVGHHCITPAFGVNEAVFWDVTRECLLDPTSVLDHLICHSNDSTEYAERKERKCKNQPKHNLIPIQNNDENMGSNPILIFQQCHCIQDRTNFRSNK